MTRAKRLQAVKNTRKQEKAIIAKLRKSVEDITDICALDEERMQRRVQTALSSEYGRINGMINLLAAVTKWPAEQGDGASVSANKALIEKELKLDLMLLEDITAYKGYHTFHTDELEVINGTTPDYDNYADHCSILLEDLGFERAASEISSVKWESTETRTIARVDKEVTELKAAAAEHKALMSASA